jgi:hypothetical protein
VQIFNPLPDEEFFSRNSDVEKLFQAGLDVARSLQPSCFLTGNRKSGKTEILKRVYNRMFWDQDVVVPFFHPFSNSFNSAEAFCREYFFRNILQFVGFLRKDPMLVMADEFNLGRIIQLAYESKCSWLVEILDDFQAYSHDRDLQAAAKLAIAFPATASMKAGLRAFVILDDFHRIASLPSAEEMGHVTANFMLALQSRQAPHLFSGSLKTVLKSLFKTAELPGSVDVVPLRPLKSAEAQLLFERLCQRFDVAYEPDLSLLVVQQLDNNPFYQRILVQTARRESGDFLGVRKFADLYSRALTEGNLHLYFNSLLHSTTLNPLEKIKALELLQLCSQKPLDFSIFRYFKNREGVEGYDFEKIMNALDQLTLVDYGLGVVASIQDSVFKDWIEWNFSHKISGTPLHQVSYRVTSAVLNRLSRSLQLRKYTDKTEQIRQFMLSMDCETVPGLLFDYARFHAEQDNELSLSPAANLEQAPELTLPEMISVNIVGTGLPGALDFSDQILVGRGFAGRRYANNTEIAWLVAYCPTADTVGLEEIERFYHKCQLAIQQEGLKSVKYWLLGEHRFNEAALSFAARYQIQTSNSAQFNRLYSLLLKPATSSEDQIDPKDLVSYEMIIPMVSDAELVAVRALEQIAENVEFDEKSKGQVRMALIEACINAKDAASSQTERIRLKFQTAPDRLITHLHYEPLAANEALTGKEATKGWSVKMLQTLMDEVKLCHTHHGLELVMTKYLRHAKKEAV